MAAKMEKEQESPQQEEERKSMSLGVAIGIYLATTVVIFIAAGYLAPTADRLAEITGLGGTFVGSTLLALTTSLPEFVTTIVAVRMGAADMAIGNILGSNTFNIAILLPIDAIYTKGSLLADASPVHAMTGMAVILLTSVATMGILYRAEKKKYSIIEPDALLVVLLSLLSIWGIYELTRPTGEPEIKDDPPIEEGASRRTTQRFAALGGEPDGNQIVLSGAIKRTLRGTASSPLTLERIGPLFEQAELFREIVFFGAQWRFEEAGELRLQTGGPFALSQVGEASQVDHQRGGKQRVAPLPDELHHHWRAEEALEVDV
ncbi:maX1, partial [Symbiodinium microadriaticum]